MGAPDPETYLCPHQFRFDVEFFWYVFPASLAGSFGRHRSGDFDPGRKTILDVSPPGDPIWAIYILIGVSVSAVLQYCSGAPHSSVGPDRSRQNRWIKRRPDRDRGLHCVNPA